MYTMKSALSKYLLLPTTAATGMTKNFFLRPQQHQRHLLSPQQYKFSTATTPPQPPTNTGPTWPVTPKQTPDLTSPVAATPSQATNLTPTTPLSKTRFSSLAYDETKSYQGNMERLGGGLVSMNVAHVLLAVVLVGGLTAMDADNLFR